MVSRECVIRVTHVSAHCVIKAQCVSLNLTHNNVYIIIIFHSHVQRHCKSIARLMVSDIYYVSRNAENGKSCGYINSLSIANLLLYITLLLCILLKLRVIC